MPQHSVVERSHIAFSMKIIWETAPVEAANSTSSWRSANGGGGRPTVHLMGQGDKAARARTCTAVLVTLQHFFGFGRHPIPPSYGGNRRGRKRVSHTYVHHQWLPREVQEEVTALGVALGAWREPCRAGGAAGVGGGCRTAVCGGGGGWARGEGLRRAVRRPLPHWAQRRHWPQRERLLLRPRRERQLRSVRQRPRPQGWVTLQRRRGQVGEEPGCHGG